jgi:hypothetical protein
VPCNRVNCAADGFLQVLGHPPIVLLFEVADGDEAGTGASGELGLGGGPTDAGCGTVYAEEYERGFPACGGGFPDVGVAVCGLS